MVQCGKEERGEGLPNRIVCCFLESTGGKKRGLCPALQKWPVGTMLARPLVFWRGVATLLGRD